MIQCPGKWETAIFTESAVGWLQPDYTTTGSWNPNGPPVSVPSDAIVISDATAAPEPPLDPPGILSKFHGLWQAP